MATMSASYQRDRRAKIAMGKAEGGLLPFQAAFVAAVCRKDHPPEIAALSVPRGNGKSWLCGGLVARSLTPGDELFEPGVENILVSSSSNQARIVLEFARAALGESENYRWRNDGVLHLESRARVRIVSSDARRALGLGANVRLIVADEPGAWSSQGRRLWDAMTTSLGKRRTQILVVGTIAPAPLTGIASWFPALVAEGSGDGRHVALLQADEAKWKDFDEVLRVNPVSAINPHLRRVLEREHKAALASERAARTFRQFRLNIPGDPVESQPLITAAEWERICARPVPACEGKPIIGVDLGGNRSWSAAAAVWPNGRIEAWALAPGVPSPGRSGARRSGSGRLVLRVGSVGAGWPLTLAAPYQAWSCYSRGYGLGNLRPLFATPIAWRSSTRPYMAAPASLRGLVAMAKPRATYRRSVACYSIPRLGPRSRAATYWRRRGRKRTWLSPRTA